MTTTTKIWPMLFSESLLLGPEYISHWISQPNNFLTRIEAEQLSENMFQMGFYEVMHIWAHLQSNQKNLLRVHTLIGEFMVDVLAPPGRKRRPPKHYSANLGSEEIKETFYSILSNYLHKDIKNPSDGCVPAQDKARELFECMSKSVLPDGLIEDFCKFADIYFLADLDTANLVLDSMQAHSFRANIKLIESQRPGFMLEFVNGYLALLKKSSLKEKMLTRKLEKVGRLMLVLHRFKLITTQ